MGNMCGGGMSADEMSAKQASKKIDEELAKNKKEERKEVKLLLLGMNSLSSALSHLASPNLI
jgi:hypothetical protein